MPGSSIVAIADEHAHGILADILAGSSTGPATSLSQSLLKGSGKGCSCAITPKRRAVPCILGCFQQLALRILSDEEAHSLLPGSEIVAIAEEYADQILANLKKPFGKPPEGPSDKGKRPAEPDAKGPSAKKQKA